MNKHNELSTTHTFDKIRIYYGTDNSIVVDFCNQDEVVYTAGNVTMNFAAGDTLHIVGIDGKIIVNSNAS